MTKPPLSGAAVPVGRWSRMARLGTSRSMFLAACCSKVRGNWRRANAGYWPKGDFRPKAEAGAG
ncbi:MAG: hypothetical protein H7315_20550 [Herminiimonas sp.]|nr:hypothetical protein [Herminiimonas sp.]